MPNQPGPWLRPRVDPDTEFEIVLVGAARLSMVAGGLFVLLLCLYFGRILLAPLFLAIVIGLMFGPVADRIERFGIPPALSAAAIVLLFLVLIGSAIIGFAVPLSSWMDRLPQIWARLQTEIAKWQGAFAALENLQDTARSLLAEGENMVVTVDEGSTVGSAAILAPGIAAQIVTFLVSMYFFIATRDEIRGSILSLCYSRRLRWRMAHVFRDVEALISRYMLSITAINIGLGLVVTLALWAAGVPTPLLWGLLAALVNYVAYVGPAIMTVILLAVGLATGGGPGGILTPALLYLGLNFISDQFVTPGVIGRSMRLNPFFVFLSIAFWIWLWGPIGGFVAIPSMLIAITVLQHLLPPARRKNGAASAEAAP